MILSIYCDPKLNKRLDELRNQGGISSAVAKKTDGIINRLISRGREFSQRQFSQAIGKRTKNGEWRIKNCKKYDLGNGYRLISLRKENFLIFLYIGTHDECSRWIERNKGLQYEIDETRSDFISIQECPLVEPVHTQENDPTDEYEKQLLQKIDDRILRKIFCGLCMK